MHIYKGKFKCITAVEIKTTLDPQWEASVYIWMLCYHLGTKGLVMVAILHYRKSKFCRGCMFSNAVKIILFISDVQNYIPIKLCKTAGSIHLFKITCMLKPENIKLNKNYIWDMLEIYWKEVMVTFNDNKVNIARVVSIKL